MQAKPEVYQGARFSRQHLRVGSEAFGGAVKCISLFAHQVTAQQVSRDLEIASPSCLFRFEHDCNLGVSSTTSSIRPCLSA
eukprot:6181264-Pleurochrysis_carterae.AAC.6